MSPSYTSWVSRSLCGVALIFGFQIATSAAADTCGDEFLSGVHNPYRFCSSVVDYSYLIADGETPDSMNAAVRAKAERTYIEFFPTACKESVKRALCAEAYLPCEDGVAVKKPCTSLCEATIGSDGVCNGLMERFGYQSNCSDTSIFDRSNDPQVCNALTNVEGVKLVAERNEPYVGSVCENYVEHYFVAEAAAYYAPLAPMPLPNLFQGYQEASAATWINYMPKFVSAECNTAFRKVVCGTIFMKPQPVSTLEDAFGTVYLQQYPSRELCTDYAAQCGWILNTAPTLGIDCSTSYPGWDGNPLYLYGESSQYVKGVVYNGAWTLLSTEPNMMDTELAQQSVIAPQCPYGTEVPDDPTAPGISYATPGCAIGCPSVGLRVEEREEVGTNYIIVIAVSFCIVVWVMANSIFLQKKKANIPIVIVVAVLILQNFASLLVLALEGGDQSAVCATNVSYHNINYPEFDGFNSCLSHAIIEMLCTVLMLYVVSVLSAELWLKVVSGMKDVAMKTHKLVIRIGFATAFVVWILAFFLGTDVNIYHSGAMCVFNSQDVVTHFWAFNFPVTLIVGGLVVVDIVLAYTMIKMSSATGGNSFTKIWQSYKYLFGLMLVFAVVWLLVIAIFSIDVHLIEYDSYVKGADDYFGCAFANFVSESDRTYIDICGEGPSVRYPKYLYALHQGIFLLSAFCQLVVNFMSGTVSKYYLGLIDKCFNVSIVAKLMPSKSTVESRYESKAESTVELQSKTKTVSVIATPLKKSKIIPVLSLDEEQPATHRSDESCDKQPQHPSSSSSFMNNGDGVICEGDEAVTTSGNNADNV